MPKRLLPVLPALLLTIALGACSGEDDGPEPTTAEEPEKQSACTATVEVTGDAEAGWEGEAYAITGGGNEAFYKTTSGRKSLSVYPASGEDFPQNAVFAAGERLYTTQTAEGLDIDPDGGGAEIDADATGNEPGSSVHVVASFDC